MSSLDSGWNLSSTDAGNTEKITYGCEAMDGKSPDQSRSKPLRGAGSSAAGQEVDPEPAASESANDNKKL